ncbi:amino acid permease [Catalinimonas alkaloidigena]|uniref:hypothetical protein n=1 Tax=Catalinimonas alkaloidigena TaxID=1075417 RepID=UPI00240542CB|nr:hypothetical protein [Catalinimonas alkaloidigena]MDF9798618.1 amino acid permease [Catalinimonas alkaloidigena]
MLLQQLIDLRDFFFNMLSKRNGTAYAKKKYQTMLMLIFSSYYMALSLIIAVLQYKAGIAVSPFIKENLFIQLIVGILIFAPYYYAFKLLFRKMAKYPMDKHMSTEKYKGLRKKAWWISMVGIALIVLVPWSLDRLIPAFK